jgi:hypothetical protein
MGRAAIVAESAPQNGVSNIFHDARLLRSHDFTTPTTREMSSLYNMSGSYIVAGARTPIGKLSGALAGFSAAELGGHRHC